MKGMKPVKVYSCADRVQADMLTEALRREGIPAYAESKGSGDYLRSDGRESLPTPSQKGAEIILIFIWELPSSGKQSM